MGPPTHNGSSLCIGSLWSQLFAVLFAERWQN
jgi:hypothetical protein